MSSPGGMLLPTKLCLLKDIPKTYRSIIIFETHVAEWVVNETYIRLCDRYGGLVPGRSWEFLSSPPRPDRLWSPPSLLSNGFQGLFPWR